MDQETDLKQQKCEAVIRNLSAEGKLESADTKALYDFEGENY